MQLESQSEKKMLEQQLQWTKEQIRILDAMDIKLHEMKKIAEYAAENELSSYEREVLNNQIVALKNEYRILESQRYAILH